MKVVVANHRATHRPVPACINGSCIIGFEANIMDFIKLNDVVIPTETDGHMRSIMNQVMGNFIANTAEIDSRCVHTIPPGVMVNMSVIYIKVCRGEGVTLTTIQRNTSFTSPVYLRAVNTTFRSI